MFHLLSGTGHISTLLQYITLSSAIGLKLSSNLLSLPCLGISVIRPCFIVGIRSLFCMHSCIALNNKVLISFQKKLEKLAVSPSEPGDLLGDNFKRTASDSFIVKSASQLSLIESSMVGMRFLNFYQKSYLNQ